MDEITDQTVQSHGKFVFGSNVKQPDFNEQIVTDGRSIVLSNIGKDISIDFLTEYLVNELSIGKESINLSLLLPHGKNIQEMYYLQYKLTIPAAEYSSVMCPDSWPSNVRVRDFVHKTKNTCGVQKQHFLPKKKSFPNHLLKYND